MFKSAVPLLKKGAKVLGKEALKTGLNVAADALEGQNVKESLKKRAASTGKKVVNKSAQNFGRVPGERAIKRSACKKKPRRRKIVNQNRPKDIFG